MTLKLLITLEGKGNSGKSSTYRKILYLLLNDKQACSYKIGSTYDSGWFDIKTPYESFRVDFKPTIVKLKGKQGDEIKVGITSKGDTKEVVEAALSYFRKNECDIILCTTRTKGASKEYILNFANDYSQATSFLFHKQSYNGDYEILNEELANNIYKVTKACWNVRSNTTESIKFE